MRHLCDVFFTLDKAKLSYPDNASLASPWPSKLVTAAGIVTVKVAELQIWKIVAKNSKLRCTCNRSYCHRANPTAGSRQVNRRYATTALIMQNTSVSGDSQCLVSRVRLSDNIAPILHCCRDRLVRFCCCCCSCCS